MHPVLRNNLAVLFEATGDVAATAPAGAPALGGRIAGAAVQEPGRPALPLRAYDDAATMYERSATVDPALGDDVYFKLGNLAFRRRDAVRARECWERTVSLNPGHQLARANLESLSVSL